MGRFPKNTKNPRKKVKKRQNFWSFENYTYLCNPKVNEGDLKSTFLRLW